MRATLATATCSLLGISAVASADEIEWDIDTAVLYYSEKDRVSLFEPVVSASAQLDDDNKVGFKVVLDALTGASPNGATSTSQVQTFTRPSGNGSYTAKPGETPLDDTFQDARVGLSGVWEKSLDRLARRTVAGNFSEEFDFTSIGASVGYAWDTNNRNTTYSIGGGFEYDIIEPQGGTPIPFASMASADTPQPRDGSEETRTVFDVLLGVTQVINRRTLMQFNYSISVSDGYHTDPYKIVSVIDGSAGATRGDTLDYIYENRPDSRVKQSLYWQTNYHFERDVVRFSYRILTDDWGIDSHTLNLRYRFVFDGGNYLEPHWRYYRQTAAEFYRHSLRDDLSQPDELSADMRLSGFEANTLGLKYGVPLENDSELNFRLEFYQQTGEDSPSDAIGSQRDQDLFADLEAVIAQVSYSFIW